MLLCQLWLSLITPYLSRFYADFAWVLRHYLVMHTLISTNNNIFIIVIVITTSMCSNPPSSLLVERR